MWLYLFIYWGNSAQITIKNNQSYGKINRSRG